ncbi:MAG TPA: HD domain-containing phosphohydrolase [Gemmatimonadales bacterium]
MSDPAAFLTAFTRALATLGHYGEGHPASARAAESAYGRLRDLQAGAGRAEFTFLPGEVLFGRDLLPELEQWEWSGRLAAAGVERLEVTGPVEEDNFARFLSHVAGVLGLSTDPRAELWQSGASAIRIGRVRVGGVEPTPEPRAIATLAYTLKEERDAVSFLHQEVETGGQLPLLEAYGVVRSLSLAMHGGQAMMVPLLELKEFDQYTTTHSINVSVLTMALAEFLELGPATVRAFGLSGLLHDLGKVRIPREILTKPGRLTLEERRVIEAHPVDGARMLLEGTEPLDLAAAVAYEHHLCLDGRGYPRLHYPRSAQYASRLVHVCDVYDALRTRRPYRDAWTSGEALEYIRARSGSEFDPVIAAAFTEMMRTWDGRIAIQAA